ncbi:hypothetical protein ABPG75_004198 [Micractinium tetrahymenae]
MSGVKLVHDVGTGSGSKFGVYMDGVMTDVQAGNLDLHRALAGPTLYTNIDTGRGTDSLSSGGPPALGPNALAGTTWWNIRAAQDIDPNKSNGSAYGDCSFGPVINLVMLQIKADEVDSMCPTWLYEPDVKEPENIYVAQLKKLRGITYMPPPPLPSLELAPQQPALPGAPAPEQGPTEWADAPAGAPLPALGSGVGAARSGWAAAGASAVAALPSWVCSCWLSQLRFFNTLQRRLRVPMR